MRRREPEVTRAVLAIAWLALVLMLVECSGLVEVRQPVSVEERHGSP